MNKPISEALSDESKEKIMGFLHDAAVALEALGESFEAGDFTVARASVEKVRAATGTACDGLIDVINEAEKELAK